jgi:hypothetical protein
MNFRMIKDAFLDGLSPLDVLVERPVRPGSTENLILADHPNPFILHLGQEARLTIAQMKNLRMEISKVVFKAFAEAAIGSVPKAAAQVGRVERVSERHGTT